MRIRREYEGNTKGIRREYERTWLPSPEYMPSKCLVYGFEMALGGFARDFYILHSAFCIFPNVALGSQSVAYRLPTKWLWGGLWVAWGGP
jgi:hypothetical protein